MKIRQRASRSGYLEKKYFSKLIEGLHEETSLPSAVFKYEVFENQEHHLVLCEGRLAEEFSYLVEHPQSLNNPIYDALEPAFSGEKIEKTIEADGRIFNIIASPVQNTYPDSALVKEVVGFVAETTEKKQMQEVIKHIAHHDLLTDLPNIIFFNERLKNAIVESQKKDEVLAVIYLGLDRFRTVNDALGLIAGNQFLKDFTARISNCVRSTDFVARLGGDEFVILLTELNGYENAGTVAARIVRSLREPWVYDDYKFYITTSIGIACYPNDGEESEKLIKNAYIAMERAKEQGGNKYLFYNEQIDAQVLARISLENDLRAALERKEFILFFQPQINSFTGETIGLEALIRWQHPKTGLVPPNEFIPLAEETGLIIPMGDWVLKQACIHVKKMLDEGNKPLRLAVNLSPRQFLQKNIVRRIQRIINDTGFPPHLLDIEITESAAMHDADYTIKVLNELRQIGVGISLDDFGKGYSSLNYLKYFPITKIKIDKSFVNGINQYQKDRAIVKSMIYLAQSLDINVLAEGVENEEQLNYLQKYKCEEVQGFYFSKPLPLEELAKVI